MSKARNLANFIGIPAINSSADATAITIDSSEKVGVGAPSPQEKLHVYTTADARVEIESTTGVAAFKATNNQGSYAWYLDSSADKFHLYDFTDSTNRVTLDGAGNVGIGTTSPTFNSGSGIEIQRSDSATIRVERTGTTAAAGEFFAGNDKVVLATTTNTHLQFRTNGTEHMRIDSSGRVGINNPNPPSKLSVLDTSTTWAAQIQNTNGTDGAGLFVRSDSTNNPMALGVYGNGSYRMVVRADGKVGIGSGASGSLGTTLEVSGDSSGAANNITTYNASTSASAEAAIDWALERTGSAVKIRAARISAGKQQSWTTTASTVDGYLKFLVARDESLVEAMRIDSSGRVGIGTTPGVSLDISQTNARVKVQDGTNQLNIGLWDGSNYRIEGDSNRKILITSYHSDGIHLGGSGSSNLVIKGNKIGIKNTNPGYPVHIVDGGNTAMYIEGDQTGYTQGAICIASDTTDTSGYRGQGIYLFNHGADTTWYIGGVYTASDRFDICRKGSTTSFDEGAAQSTYSLATFSNSGNLSIDGTLTQNSDVSIKDNVQNLSSQLENINALRPVEYDRNDKLKAGEHEIGLIAQEVEALLPDLVGERNGLKTLDYSRLSVILLKGLQELSAKVAALESK